MYHIVFSRVIPDQEILKLRKRESQQLILQEHQNSKCDLVFSASLQRAHHLGVQLKHWHFFCIISSFYCIFRTSLHASQQKNLISLALYFSKSTIQCFLFLSAQTCYWQREKRPSKKSLYSYNITQTFYISTCWMEFIQQTLLTPSFPPPTNDVSLNSLQD